MYYFIKIKSKKFKNHYYLINSDAYDYLQKNVYIRRNRILNKVIIYYNYRIYNGIKKYYYILLIRKRHKDKNYHVTLSVLLLNFILSKISIHEKNKLKIIKSHIENNIYFFNKNSLDCRINNLTNKDKDIIKQKPKKYRNYRFLL